MTRCKQCMKSVKSELVLSCDCGNFCSRICKNQYHVMILDEKEIMENKDD